MERLDQLLQDGAPAVSSADAAVALELEGLGARVGAQHRVPVGRVRRRVGVVVATAVLAVAGAGVAAAVPGIADLLGWAPDVVVEFPEQGAECVLGLVVTPESALGVTDPSFLAARRALGSIALADLDLAAKRAELQGTDLGSGDTAELFVRLLAAMDRVNELVEAQGLDSTAYGIQAGDACPGDGE